MEAFATYLIKSSVWLTGFALVYALFLRNERFFTLNRIYLVSGILFSMIFPLFTWHYTVILPIVPSVEISEPQVQGIIVPEESFNPQNLLLLVYLAGILYLSYRILRQTLPVFRIIRKSETHLYSSAKLIRTDAYPASFSFFSFVFVNPSIDETETNEIVNHELEHIRQQHWIDLLLFEILRTMQWFNPVSWLYGHLIRQNHEYLADERALQRSSNPAIYRAALLNQMFGGPVISLANSFNYSLNKKRFNMMKQKIESPLRKLKLLLALPLIAGVFYAFATPEYKYIQSSNNPETQLLIPEGKTVNGKVISEDGKPLKGATVIIKGSTIGTVTDEKGNFKLIVSDNSPLVISYVGFETVSQPLSQSEMTITLKRKIVSIEFDNKTSETRKNEQIEVIKSNALVIVDGKEITKDELEKISPDKIESISVLKNESATILYGEKGKDGVILLTLKNDGQTNQSLKLQANSPLIFKNTDGSGSRPLIVKDGLIAENENVNNIPPETIESINVLKGESATKKYGEKGKNGVVEITLKHPDEKSIIVESMPEFPGGVEALKKFVSESLQYPKEALEKGIQGQVMVGFVVSKSGEITDVRIKSGIDPSLDNEAVRIAKSMPKWTPGKQNGQGVDVFYKMPVNFSLPSENRPVDKTKSTGSNSKIGTINWVNNTIFSSAELNKVLRMQKGDQYSKELINRRIWTDLDGVSSIYIDKGYAFSNIETSENQTNDGTINLTFTIYEGKRAKIGKIDINGNKSVSTEEILPKIVIKPGDLFSKTKIIQSVEALSKMGIFDSEEIKPAVIPNSQNFSGEFGTIDLVFNVKEI
jgi:TonB family protein